MRCWQRDACWESSFEVLFTDGLYERLGAAAVEMAAALKKGLKQRGYTFFRESPTNQQFVILENDRMEQIEKEVSVSFWERYDEDHTVVRFATSWATREAGSGTFVGDFRSD